MITPEQIEEWIKEVEERPGSAAIIIQYISNRLRDLTNQNEKLRAENIVLRTGQRVETYEKRIAHLEYQLDLLKRQFGGELPSAEELGAARQRGDPASLESINILVYNSLGRVLRLKTHPEKIEDGSYLASLSGSLMTPDGDPPRLLAVSAREELMLVFTTGRIATLPVESIPAVKPEAMGDSVSLDQASIPDEPRAGETLACLMPISQMALAELFIQISRRGFAKKIRMAMAPSIMDNRYIGTGVKVPADETLDIILGGKDDRLVMVSQEGYLSCLDVGMLSYSVEEAMRLGSTDHLVSAFASKPEGSILIMTQLGKGILRNDDDLESARGLKLKGQALYSRARRDKGVKVVGGAAANEEDWGLALHQDGQLTIHAMRTIFDTGVVTPQGELLAFGAISIPAAANLLGGK